jgi:hypothetical protein
MHEAQEAQEVQEVRFVKTVCYAHNPLVRKLSSLKLDEAEPNPLAASS